MTWTLISRFIRKQNVFEAHREHFYQLIMRLGGSHARVAVIYMSLISFSAGAAIFMLALPASLHWLTPLALSLVFAAGGVVIYRQAGRKALLASPALSGAALSAAE